MIDNIPWIEKYRPRKLKEIEQASNLIDLFHNNISTGEMTHYLFYGPPGTGKTSAILAIGREIFKEYFSTRVIEFNAADDRGINAVREKITNEAKKYVAGTVSIDGSIIPSYKIIILDEADSMTDEAQDALRVIIEQYSNVTRFCFICNYISKITDAIKSRCSAVYFKRLDNYCMMNKLNEIATKECMNLPGRIMDNIMEVSNGDMRKAIMLLQNLKYLYDFKSRVNIPFCDIPTEMLKYVPVLNVGEKSAATSSEITEEDIYNIASSITISRAHQIIEKVLTSKNILEIAAESKKIIALGYPIDNILLQLTQAILETKKLNDEQKANVIFYSGRIFLKIKECANEYIQLLDYLSCIYGTKHGIDAYKMEM